MKTINLKLKLLFSFVLIFFVNASYGQSDEHSSFRWSNEGMSDVLVCNVTNKVKVSETEKEKVLRRPGDEVYHHCGDKISSVNNCSYESLLVFELFEKYEKAKMYPLDRFPEILNVDFEYSTAQIHIGILDEKTFRGDANKTSIYYGYTLNRHTGSIYGYNSYFNKEYKSVEITSVGKCNPKIYKKLF